MFILYKRAAEHKATNVQSWKIYWVWSEVLLVWCVRVRWRLLWCQWCSTLWVTTPKWPALVPWRDHPLSLPPGQCWPPWHNRGAMYGAWHDVALMEVCVTGGMWEVSGRSDWGEVVRSGCWRHSCGVGSSVITAGQADNPPPTTHINTGLTHAVMGAMNTHKIITCIE